MFQTIPGRWILQERERERKEVNEWEVAMTTCDASFAFATPYRREEKRREGKLSELENPRIFMYDVGIVGCLVAVAFIGTG